MRRIRSRRSSFARSARPSIAIRLRPTACTCRNRSRKSSSFATGGGPWRQLLEEVGAWNRGVDRARRQSRAVSRRQRLSRRAVARRARRADDAARISSRLASRGATLVTCPRSNGHTGAGAPPIEDFYASGVHVAIGTDSLASAPDLNVFAELATLRALAPVGAGVEPAGERHDRGGAGARLRRRLRHDRAGQVCAARGRRRSSRHGRCGRIPGVGSPAGIRSVGWRRELHAETPRRLPVVRPLQPFGVRAAVCAGRCAARGAARTSEHIGWGTIGWILVAMVAARSAAMGFNRLVDARLDALNPRTANRELPRGAMSRAEAVAFVVVASALFVFAASRLNPLCFMLSPVALAIVFWYSLAKRFTTWTQLFLGLAMAVAPVGGWLAVGGRRRMGAVAARARDRHVGRRIRRAVRLPGPRLRSRARSALDSGPLRRSRGARDLARACTSSRSCAWWRCRS